jgi:hypothetical protein
VERRAAGGAVAQLRAHGEAFSSRSRNGDPPSPLITVRTTKARSIDPGSHPRLAVYFWLASEKGK